MAIELRARPQLHLAPVPGGVYISGATGQFVLRGPEVLFAVADRCLPLLEDGTTEDDLVGALGSERARAIVRHLVQQLDEHRMLLRLDALTMPDPGPHARRRCPEALAHLESFADDPYAVFARLGASRVVVMGGPDMALPAARGLARCGVGALTLVTDRADGLLSSLAVDALVVADRPDARAEALRGASGVVWCMEQSGNMAGSAEELAVLPADRPVVPVWAGEESVVVGPAGSSGHTSSRWLALWQRVAAETERCHSGRLGRPVADALGGAYAAQLLFEALTGSGRRDLAVVIHGDDLAAEEIIVAATPTVGVCRLADVAAESLPAPEEVRRWLDELTAPWTGAVSLGAGDDFPQLPVSLREASFSRIVYRPPESALDRSVVAWGFNQHEAMCAAALEALRAGGDGSDEYGFAAGLTEERWLLDGCLRQLAERAVDTDPLPSDPLDPEAGRLAEALTRRGGPRPRLRRLRVPDLGWELWSVTAGPSGSRGVRAWGEDANDAIRRALGTAVARCTAFDRRGLSSAPGRLNTDVLISAGGVAVGRLRDDLAATGVAEGVSGKGRATAQVPGPWFGSVRIESPGAKPHGADVGAFGDQILSRRGTR